MKFSYVCWSGVFFILILTLLTESCVKMGRKRAQPECSHGKEADGTCRKNPIELTNICKGEFGIKESGISCVFFTAAYPNGCQMPALQAYKSMDRGCIVIDAENRSCIVSNLDMASLTCLVEIKRDPAAVSIYLEVQEEGFKPHIVFDPSEKAKEGAILALGEQNYRGTDIAEAQSDDGRTTLSMALKIPWKLTYTKEDGTEVCADGILSGNNSSKETAARGNICL